MDELIAQFAIEARELVQQASKDLLSLEADPQNRESAESAFRAIHTLKGSVGLFEFGPMQGILHQAEDLLSQARAGRIVIDTTLIEPLLAVVEWIDDSIEGISRTGHLSEAQDKQAPRLLGLLNGKMAEREISEDVGSTTTIPGWAQALQQRIAASDIEGSMICIRYEPHPECFFNGDDPLATISRLPDLRHLAFSLKEPPPSPQDYDPFRCHLLIEAVSGGSLAEAEAVFRLIPDQVNLVPLPRTADKRAFAAPEKLPERSADRQSTTMRVDSARIDKLVEIAGELIATKNGLVPLADEARNQGNGPLARRILSSHHELERLLGSLYSALTQARMIPVEHTFRRFPRLVRETSARLGKALDLIIEGETVEADREIVENLFEPLLHLIRNGLDHGIEPEAERLRFSKPARGRILLRARQRGDQIDIEVADDGRGMDPNHVRAAAIDRGLLSKSQASVLSDREILQFVFVPGFSTASSVSDLSGRGVGLDAVQNSVKRLGGTLELQSAVGVGTSFVLKLPISFSMTQLMVVEVGDERYGIPISDVMETHKLPTSAIQPVRAGRAFVLRDRTIPLLYLGELLKIPSWHPRSGDLKVLIVRTGEHHIGVSVDAIAERVETLTRPLVGLLQGVPGIAGTTLLGDGRVLLVLDMEELIQ
ncbi:CheA signal transduction histidine kinase [Rhizobium sp. CF080]|uniref:chemotaxis protein CheA n=1 Tax=Rhizobium sp. (strain CF080) TaxID=1144310 RepID=UPI0002715E6E|nr:chemotaxis protein CheA [Rhizobium sp. CF080]EUB98313.1 CheA signal transduction histidine kinase [Rhizobium sp. CF080]